MSDSLREKIYNHLTDITISINTIRGDILSVKSIVLDLDERLTNLEARFDGLEARFDGLEARFDGLEAELKNTKEELNLKIDGIKEDIYNFKEEFRDFTGEEELEHIATRKVFNQAFVRITENIRYQEKVDKIEQIIKGRQARGTSFFNTEESYEKNNKTLV